jgi:putative MATE family efflux protein
VSSKHNIDITHGPLVGKILLFSVPVMLTSLLQVAFNAADVIVVGQFAGYSSLAAVGTAAPTIFLFINLLVGIAVGVNVLIANYVGAGHKERKISDALHTSIVVAIFGGFLFGGFGFAMMPSILEWMSTPADIYDKALLYIRIYFMGTPFLMAYNYGTATLRAIGDTRRPLIFLIISGIVNVILNLVFVILFRLDVAGVAIATVISEGISAYLVLRCLSFEKGPWRFSWRLLHLDRQSLFDLCRIGIPAGLQNITFSISNIVIQSAINTYGSIVVAAGGAAATVENVMYIIMNSFHQASMTFVGQNLGAGQWDRVKRVVKICVIMVSVTGLLEAAAVRLWAPQMIRIFNNDPAVVEAGRERLLWVTLPYFIFGIADTLVGTIRGFGISVAPMVVNIFATCIFRLLWIWWVDAPNCPVWMVYLAWPVSWGLLFAILVAYWIYLYRKTESLIARKRGKGYSPQIAVAAAEGGKHKE